MEMETSPTKSDDGESTSGSGYKRKSISKLQLKSTLGSYWNVEAPVPENTVRIRRSNAGSRMKEITEALHRHGSKHKSKSSGDDSSGPSLSPEKIQQKTKKVKEPKIKKEKSKKSTSIEGSPQLPELLVPNRSKRPNAGAKMKEISAQLLSPKAKAEVKEKRVYKSRKSLPASSVPSPTLKASRKSEPIQLAPTTLFEEDDTISHPEITEGIELTSGKYSESVSPSGQRQKTAALELPIPTKTFKVQNISSTKIKLSKLSFNTPAKPTRNRSDSISNEESLELEEISHSKAVLSALRIPEYLAGEKSAHKSKEIEAKVEKKKYPCVHEEDFAFSFDPDIPEPEPEKDIDYVKEVIELSENDVCSFGYCKFGCVCESLRGTVLPSHCGKPKCFFECSCGVKPTLEIEDTGDIRSRLRPRARLLNWKRLAGLENEEEFNNKTPLDLDLSKNTKLSRKAAAIRLKKKYAITPRKPRGRGLKRIPIPDKLDEDFNSDDGMTNNVHLAKDIWENESSLNVSSPDEFSETEDTQQQTEEEPKVVKPKYYTTRPCLKVPELTMLVSPDDGSTHALFRWTESGLPKSINVLIENKRIPLIDLPIPPMGMHWLFYKIPPETNLFSIMTITQPRIQFVLRSLIGKLSLTRYRNKTQVFLLVDENRKPLLGNLPCFVYLLPNMPNLLLLGPYPKTSMQNPEKHMQAKFRQLNTGTPCKTVGIPRVHFEELFGEMKISEKPKVLDNRTVENEDECLEENQELIPQEVMKMFIDSCIVEKEQIRKC